ncbi:MAG: 16S rRNA (guanine(527)-N(7))-methyltransferase RsmG [Syntrophales bacterium]|nr:16S rRNA (guanine(527)-N(7))-methyltransferase RsmG [Syntrophales bacterium]
MENTQHILAGAARDIGIILTDHEIGLLMEYYRELLFWNEKMSLVSLKSPLDITKHLIDSLTPARLIKDDHSKLLDIGTGAGLPGLPLKITRESLHVTLLDASRKKTSFLKSVIRKLGLRDISVINSRAESLAFEKTYRGSFDIVISRATFKIPYFLAVGEPFLSDGGTLIAMKGKHVDAELAQGADTIGQTCLVLTESHEIELPITGESRKLLCFTKNLS